MIAFNSLADLQVPLAAKIIGDADIPFAGVSTDSRALRRGNLFVALKGAKFNGHEFVEDAIRLGTSAVLVSEPPPDACQVPAVLVSDTAQALGRLGAINRIKWRGELVAVTGSNGKTTTKEILGAILTARAKDKVLLTAANLNNTLGVPQTLLKLSPQHDYAVVEMGTDSPGEIPYSAFLAKPNLAIITNVGKAHLQGFGSRANIAREKGSILEHITADGLAIINGDDDFCPLWREILKIRRRPAVTFGFGKECDLRLGRVESSAGKLSFDLTATANFLRLLESRAHKKLTTNRPLNVTLPLAGEHNAMNAAAAFAAGACLGLEPALMLKALAKFKNLGGRLELVALANNCLLYDDSYNANPTSMAAALHTLAGAKAERRFAVLGDMHELGDDAIKEHRQIGELAARLKLDGLLCCGEFAAATIKGYKRINQNPQFPVMALPALDELQTTFTRMHKTSPFQHTAFLVKGSRASSMEKAADFIRVQLGAGK